jgi:malate dehydrogenase
MNSVAILGAGELAGSVAQALAARDRVARIILIDAAARVAAGKALDIQQSGALDGFHTQLSGTDDLSAVTGCRVCIVADDPGPGSLENGDNRLATVGRVAQYATGAPIVFAGAMAGELLQRTGTELHTARERLVGSAPEALASAIRSMVALETVCSPSEVMLGVLGVPPEGLVVPWSEASIGGYALDRVLTQAQLARLEKRAARLWPPGPLTLGLAAARMAEAMLIASRRSFSAFALLDGQFGVRNHVAAMPVFLGLEGIRAIREPTLNPRERVRVETALKG